MGKQISFYQAKDDEQDFMAFVRSKGEVLLLAQTSENELEEFRFFFELEGRKFGEACHLWNRAISPRPKIEHYPEKGYYCVDFMQSEVVNVMRSKQTKQGLTMGRLHIEDKTLETDGRMTTKSEPFMLWYSGLCSWIQQRYKKKVNGAHLGPGVQSLMGNGIKLTGHSV